MVKALGENAEDTDLGSIPPRIENLFSDWFGFVRIDVLESIGLSRIEFLPIFIKPDLIVIYTYFEFKTDLGFEIYIFLKILNS